MKRISAVMVLCLVIPAFLLAQQSPASRAGEAEGTKLGNIISTVIGIVLPPLQPLIERIFPKPSSKNVITISKADLQARIDLVKSEMMAEVGKNLARIGIIVAEVDCLRTFLRPCIKVQDLLREINVLIARSPIDADDWNDAKVAWSSVKALIRKINEIDVDPVRGSAIKVDLRKMQDVDESTLNKLDAKFFGLPLGKINDGDNATLLRVKMGDYLELYLTAQFILDQSLIELRDDFQGASNALVSPSDLLGGVNKSLGELEVVSKSLGGPGESGMEFRSAQMEIARRLQSVKERIKE